MPHKPWRATVWKRFQDRDASAHLLAAGVFVTSATVAVVLWWVFNRSLLARAAYPSRDDADLLGKATPDPSVTDAMVRACNRYAEPRCRAYSAARPLETGAFWGGAAVAVLATAPFVASTAATIHQHGRAPIDVSKSILPTSRDRLKHLDRFVFLVGVVAFAAVTLVLAGLAVATVTASTYEPGAPSEEEVGRAKKLLPEGWLEQCRNYVRAPCVPRETLASFAGVWSDAATSPNVLALAGVGALGAMEFYRLARLHGGKQYHLARAHELHAFG